MIKFTPKVSIIIPVYNGENFVKEAIVSVINQTYRNFEIIVINDGSTDHGKTKEAIMEYKKDIIYREKENGGVASALNLGIDLMQGEYFLWLSHDDLLKPTSLETYVEKLQIVPDETTLIWGNYDLINEDSLSFGIQDFSSYYPTEKLEMSVFPVVNGYVNACATLIHKSHFERVGKFNEELRIAQDNEFLFRVFRRNTTFFCKEILCSKRYHSNQDSLVKNIYPEEDQLIEMFLENITLMEAAEFEGTSSVFYEKTLNRFSDGFHPLTTQLCKKKLKYLSYEIAKMEKNELVKLLDLANKDSQKSYKDAVNLKKDYQKLKLLLS